MRTVGSVRALDAAGWARAVALVREVASPTAARQSWRNLPMTQVRQLASKVQVGDRPRRMHACTRATTYSAAAFRGRKNRASVKPDLKLVIKLASQTRLSTSGKYLVLYKEGPSSLLSTRGPPSKAPTLPQVCGGRPEGRRGVPAPPLPRGRLPSAISPRASTMLALECNTSAPCDSFEQTASARRMPQEIKGFAP